MESNNLRQYYSYDIETPKPVDDDQILTNSLTSSSFDKYAEKFTITLKNLKIEKKKSHQELKTISFEYDSVNKLNDLLKHGFVEFDTMLQKVSNQLEVYDYSECDAISFHQETMNYFNRAKEYQAKLHSCLEQIIVSKNEKEKLFNQTHEKYRKRLLEEVTLIRQQTIIDQKIKELTEQQNILISSLNRFKNMEIRNNNNNQSMIQDMETHKILLQTKTSEILDEINKLMQSISQE